MLGHCVNRVEGNGNEAGGGTGDRDARPAVCGHQRQHRLDAEEDAVHVDADNGAVAFVGDGADAGVLQTFAQARGHDAGIEVEIVDRTDYVRDGRPAGGIGHVAEQELRCSGRPKSRRNVRASRNIYLSFTIQN